MIRAAGFSPCLRRPLAMATFFSLLLGAGCSGRPESGSTIRLVDKFDSMRVENAPVQTLEPPSLDSWEFSAEGPEQDRNDAMVGWTAVDGVRDFGLRGGRLSGSTTTEWPLLLAERSRGLEDRDLIYSLEIRMRASEGANLRVALLGRDLPPPKALPAMARNFPWWEETPIVAGETFQTYQIRFGMEKASADAGHVLLRPTDGAGADFEIESIRLISRRQRLARIPSGVGWHGFGDIYRETIVSRSPETLRFETTLPERPRLELQAGTVDFPPVTFRVEVRPEGGRGPSQLVLNRTITTPHRWEDVSVDLSSLAGRHVELALTLEAEEPGSLGFWGTPTIRSVTAPPAPEPRPLLQTAEAPPRGVILVLADTLRKDHLNAYGYRRKTAPLLAEMADRGVRFDHNLVQATWTKVSAPAILTSMYPTSHRVADFHDRISAAAVTLAEVYRQAGYATVAYSSVPFTGKFTNLHQGFEELHESSSLTRKDSSKTAREYVDRLAKWLQAHRDSPFFVFLHVFDPHDPFEPDRPWNSHWADPAQKDAHRQTEERLREVIADPLMRRFGMPTREDLIQVGADPEAFIAHNKDWYDGSIRGLDVEIARLMGHLQDLGLDRETLVVFTSDHGEEFLEHGRTFHGQSAYGELTQVPLIFYQPSLLPEGLTIGEVTQSIDIMPTILELSRLPAPDSVMGQSLLPLIEAARRVRQQPNAGDLLEVAASLGWQRRPAVTEKAATGGNASPPPRDTEAFAVVWDGWKLVHHTVRPRGGPEFELFRFPEDPFDERDLAGQHPEIVQQLADKLAQWREQALAAQLPETLPTEGLGKEELDRLRSLGYIQ